MEMAKKAAVPIAIGTIVNALCKLFFNSNTKDTKYFSELAKKFFFIKENRDISHSQNLWRVENWIFLKNLKFPFLGILFVS
jgi:hypothetical protein